MHIEKAVYLILSGDASLTALVPADRIYPEEEIQNVVLPNIKHFVVADKSLYVHSGRVSLRNSEFYQVSVYAARRFQVRQIAEAVINALSGTHEVGSPAEGVTAFHENSHPLPYDETVRAAGMALDFSIWYGN